MTHRINTMTIFTFLMMTTTAMAQESMPVAAPSLALLDPDDDVVVFAGPLRSRQHPLVVTARPDGLRVQVGEQTVEDPTMLNLRRPAGLCPGRAVAFTGVAPGGDAVVVVISVDDDIATVDTHRLNAPAATRVAPMSTGEGACGWVVIDEAGTLWQRRDADVRMTAHAFTAVSNGNEHPRGLPLLVRGEVVEFIDGAGARTAWNTTTAVHVSMTPIGLAWPEVLGAPDGSWLVTIAGALVHIDDEGQAKVMLGVGIATAGPTPLPGGTMVWPLADGRIAVAHDGTITASSPTGSHVRQPLLVLPLLDDALHPVAALHDGRLAILDDVGEVLAFSETGARAHGPLYASQTDADHAPTLSVQRGDGRVSHLAAEVPARPWHAMTGAVPATFVQIGPDGVERWQGPPAPEDSAPVVASPTPTTTTPSTPTTNAAAGASCQATPTAPMLLFLLGLVRRRHRRHRNETVKENNNVAAGPHHCPVLDWNAS